MAVTKKDPRPLIHYNDIYPNSTDTARKAANPEVEVDCYYIEYVDEVTGDKRELPVYLDENGHPFVSLDLDGSGTPKFYPLLGGGSAPIPPMTEVGEDGKKKEIGPSVNGEVLYVDIYNDKGIQEKIYLPAQRKYIAADGTEKTANDDFVDGFKKVFSFDEAFLATVPVHTGAEPAPITRATANKHFLSTHLPAGDLVYNKMNTAGDAVEMSYLYITHDNAGHREFVRMMVKPGEDKLYINLDGVKKDSSGATYPNGKTFEVRKFTISGTTLHASVFDGVREIDVDLGIPEAEAKASSLYNAGATPPDFYTPHDIATRTTNTEIKQIQLPDCPNISVLSSTLGAVEADLGKEGELSKSTNRTGAELKETTIKVGGTNIDHCMTQEVVMKSGVANPFGTENQTLSTFNDPSGVVLLTISEGTDTIATIENDGAGKKHFKLTKKQVEKINAAGEVIPSPPLPADMTTLAEGDFIDIGEIDASTIEQDMNGLVVVKLASGGNLQVTSTSMGMAVKNVTTNQVGIVKSSHPLNVGVSDAYIEEAMSNSIKADADKSECRIDAPWTADSALGSALLISETRRWRAKCIAEGHPEKLKDGYEICSDPLTVVYSLPTGGKDASGNDVYIDLRFGPEKDRDGKPVPYFFGHVTTEHKEGEAGVRATPKYHKIESVIFSEHTVNPIADGVPATAPVVMMETRLRGTTKLAVGAPLGAEYGEDGKPAHQMAADIYEVFNKYNLYAAPSGGSTAGTRTFGSASVPITGRDTRSFATYLDENITQMQRDAAAPTPDTTIPDIADPQTKAAEGTKDSPRPREPKQREKIQLWKGIKDSTKKNWIAATAVITLFSVFIPFLNVIAGILIGIIVANDTEFVKSIFLEREYVHDRLTPRGRQFDRELAKNQRKIRELNATLDIYNDQLLALDKSGKTPRQIARERAILQQRIADTTADKQSLIARNHDLAIEVIRDQDLGLRAELKSNEKWQRILRTEEQRFNTINTLDCTISGTTLGIKDFDFRSSDADLAEYRTQLESLRRDKGNKHVKDILTQQIEFCEMVQLYRRDVRKLSSKESARLTRLSTIYSPTSNPPITDWNARISALIAKTGITPAFLTRTGLEAEATRIHNSLSIDLNASKRFLNPTHRSGSLYEQIHFRLYGTGPETARGGKLLRTIDQIAALPNEAAFVTWLRREGATANCEDLVKLKYLLNKTPLSAAEMTTLDKLRDRYPRLARNKDFDLLAELRQEATRQQDALRHMDDVRAILGTSPLPTTYYTDILQIADQVQDPRVRAAMIKTAQEHKFTELVDLAQTGILSANDKKLLEELAEVVEVKDSVLSTTTKGQELLEYKALLNKKRSELTPAELARLDALKTKYPDFKKGSSVASYAVQDLLSMSEAAYMQAVTEEVILVAGPNPENLSIEDLETILNDSTLGAGLDARVKTGLQQLLTDQLEFKEYQHLKEIESAQLTPAEKKRLEKLKAKYTSSKSPISSFLDESQEYQEEIDDYLRRSDEYIEERRARADESVKTDEIIEGGDPSKGIGSGIDRGLAEYDARGEARRHGGNLENQDDKAPKVEGTDKKDTAEYKGDGTSTEDTTEDVENKTEDAKRRRRDNDSRYGSDGRRSDGRGR